jgi:hypothetical protein
MMAHLQEIEDAAARDGVYAFQTQMEVIVLSLLDEDRDIALTQIEEARVISIDNVKNVGVGFLSIARHPKAGRVVTAMLKRTFERLRIVIEAPDDRRDRSSAKAH